MLVYITVWSVHTNKIVTRYTNNIAPKVKAFKLLSPNKESMRKWMSLYSVIIIVLVYNTGCKKADIEFGEQFIDAGYTNVIVVDTLTPIISTIFRDSIATSQSSSVLIGSYKDPYFGKVTANSFFVLSSPSTSLDFHISAAYDSLVLQMRGDS